LDITPAGGKVAGEIAALQACAGGIEGTPLLRREGCGCKCNGGLGLGDEAEAKNVIPLELRVKSSYGGGCKGAEGNSGSSHGLKGAEMGALRADCELVGTDWD